MDFIDARLLITLGGVIVSVVASFVVVRQKVQEQENGIKSNTEKLYSIDSRLDRNDTATDLLKQRIDIIAKMNSPENRDKLSRELERINVKIETLENDVSSLKKMHNGRHPES